jgi:hypothetical protein
MRLSPYAFIGMWLFATAAVQAEASPFFGRFQGTGRACYGTLAVTAKTISWQTPFSQCKSMPYELIERASREGKMRMTYRLKPGASCRYTVLTLTHSGTIDDTGWEVTAYGSETSYQTDKSSGYKTRSEDMLSCRLVRDDG